jgi:hypothetical protein
MALSRAGSGATAPGLSRVATTLLIERLQRLAQPPAETRGPRQQPQDNASVNDTWRCRPRSLPSNRPRAGAAAFSERPGFVTAEVAGLRSARTSCARDAGRESARRPETAASAGKDQPASQPALSLLLARCDSAVRDDKMAPLRLSSYDDGAAPFRSLRSTRGPACSSRRCYACCDEPLGCPGIVP